MIVKKMKYIFLLIFTLQNYNFCCEECCNCWEECWNNCWNNSPNVQNSFLQEENSQGANNQGENSINNNFHLWKDKNTTKFETTDIKSGICENNNFESGNTFPYYEQFYIPTKDEIQNKKNTSLYQDIPNYQYIADFICKNNNYFVIVKNIFPYCKKDNNGNDNTPNLAYYVPIFLIYEKEQNVYKLKLDKAFFVFIENAKINFSSEDWYKDVNSWNRKIKKQIKNNLQNLENIKDNIRDIGAIFDIDFSKKNVSNIIYNNNEVENIIDKNFDLKSINLKDGCWRKGLQNIGATCYMNATLQCFAHMPDFVTFFRKDKQVQDVINEKVGTTNLTTAFAELFQNLYPTNLENMKEKGYYAPRNFKETISQMNPLFKGIAANDAKDLVNFLIMTLHNELNDVVQNQNEEFTGNIFEDQRNKQLMLQNFSKNFVKTHNSFISNFFYALNYNRTQCSLCRALTYNYQIYFFLIFPLEEVRKYKLMGNNGAFNFNQNINEVNIKDCFEFDQKDNIMSGTNDMYCNYCKNTCASSMCTKLATGPEILIIILNRGKGNEFKVKLNFSEKLDLSDYIELKKTGTQYELFGVITHIGESSMSGHFIAYCKDLWDDTWYKYNDAFVDPVNNFQEEVVNFAMPYLLFYKKKDNNMFKNNNHNVISQINNMNFQNNNNPFNNMNPQFNNMFFQNNNMNPNNNIFPPFNNMNPQFNNMNYPN